MKTLKELKGVKVLSKTEQKAINGGYQACDGIGHNCWPGWYCYYAGWHDKYTIGTCLRGGGEA